MHARTQRTLNALGDVSKILGHFCSCGVVVVICVTGRMGTVRGEESAPLEHPRSRGIQDAQKKNKRGRARTTEGDGCFFFLSAWKASSASEKEKKKPAKKMHRRECTRRVWNVVQRRGGSRDTHRLLTSGACVPARVQRVRRASEASCNGKEAFRVFLELHGEKGR